MTRREALAWLARAAAVGCVFGAACPAWGGDGTSGRKGKKKKEKKKKLKRAAWLFALRNGAATELDDPDLILARSAKGIAAFVPVCTHKHTPLAVDKSGHIYCPLHGSQFNLAGQPTGGPATRRLKWLKTTVQNNGAVYVDTHARVPPGTWAPLPAWARPKKAKP